MENKIARSKHIFLVHLKFYIMNEKQLSASSCSLWLNRVVELWSCLFEVEAGLPVNQCLPQRIMLIFF